MISRNNNNITRLMSKLVLFVTIVSSTCFYSINLNAQSMNDFIKTFSGICFQTLGNFDNARAILNYQKWEAMDENMLSVLGRPANPEAEVEGYVLKRNAKGRGYILALTTVPNTTQAVCSLIPGSEVDYTENIKQLEQFFDVKKQSSNNEGLVISEMWRIKHPLYKTAMVMTQKYTDRKPGADLGQFHLYGLD